MHSIFKYSSVLIVTINIGAFGDAIVQGTVEIQSNMRDLMVAIAAINVRTGGRNKSSGIIHGLFLLVVLLGLSNVVQYIPNAVLAGILVGAGLGIIDYRSISHLRSAPRSDVLVILLTIFMDMVAAVGIGMIVAALIFMAKVAEISEKNMALILAEEDPWVDESAIPESLRKHILIKHVTGPLFFGLCLSCNRSQSYRREDTRISHGSSILYQSSLYALQDVITDLEALGLQVYLVGLSETSIDRMKAIHIIPCILGEDRNFNDFDSFQKILSQLIADLPACHPTGFN